MHVGVRLVFELPAQEPAVRLGKLGRLRKHAAAFERGRCQHDPCAEEAHQPAPLDAEVLSHGHNERIALLCAHHGEPDTRIPAGGFDYRLSRFESSRPLGIFDDAKSQSILDRSHGIEGFYLDVQGYVRRCELLYPHHRRASDRLEDAVKAVPGEGVPRGAGGRRVECLFVHGHVFVLRGTHHAWAAAPPWNRALWRHYYERPGKIARFRTSFTARSGARPESRLCPILNLDDLEVENLSTRLE